MPVTFQYENNKQGLIITAYGKVDGEEFLNRMGDHFHDEELIRHYRYGINDFTCIEKFDITTGQIASLAKIHIKAAKLNSEIVVGFAITKPVIYGLVRIWMAYAMTTGWQINIKKTLPEINSWVKENLTQEQKAAVGGLL